MGAAIEVDGNTRGEEGGSALPEELRKAFRPGEERRGCDEVEESGGGAGPFAGRREEGLDRVEERVGGGVEEGGLDFGFGGAQGGAAAMAQAKASA